MCRNKKAFLCQRDREAPVPVRPHHGMCLAFFKGYGYSDAFSRHMQEMLELFEKNVMVKLTVAADEICRACPNNKDGICISADCVERYDHAVLDICGFQEGMELPFFTFAETVQREILASGNRLHICSKCQWNDICLTQKSRWENLTV